MAIQSLAIAVWGLLLIMPSATPHATRHNTHEGTITLCRATVLADAGRCTGSASCSACRNCSRCAHCSSGGSCGVCADNARTYAVPKRTSPHQYSGPSRTTITRSNNTVREDLAAANTDAKTLVVISQTLNLREGPGKEYPIVARLTYSDELTFISVTGDWLKVTTMDGEYTGFVYWRYVVVEKD